MSLKYRVKLIGRWRYDSFVCVVCCAVCVCVCVLVHVRVCVFTDVYMYECVRERMYLCVS
jgi:hypothetical protein